MKGKLRRDHWNLATQDLFWCLMEGCQAEVQFYYLRRRMKIEKMGMCKQFIFCWEGEKKNGEKIGKDLRSKEGCFMMRNTQTYCRVWSCIWTEIDDGNGHSLEWKFNNKGEFWCINVLINQRKFGWILMFSENIIFVQFYFTYFSPTYLQ